jgi:hypothetical protein
VTGLARDVEFNVTADDKTGTALTAAEKRFAESQKRIGKANETAIKKRQKDEDAAAGKIGRTLEKTFGQAGLNFGKSITTQLSAAGEASGPLIAVGIAAAAPVIGATLSAAIIGGAGVGGVLGGVLLASRDPRVAAAGSQLGQNLLGQLTKDAEPFIVPILKNIAKIESRFDSMNTRIKQIFSTSSGFLDPLVDGALNAVDGILRGVDALVDKGAPVIDAISESFGILGDSIGDAFEVISGGADESASALVTVAKAVGAVIVATGYLVRGLTEAYGVISFIPGKLSAVSDQLATLAGRGDAAEKTITGVSRSAAAAVIKQTQLGAGYSSSAEGLAYTNELLAANQKRLDEAAQAAQRKLDADRDLYGAEIGVAQAFADANKSIKEHGRGLDLNTQKGRDNSRTLESVSQNINKQYENLIELNGVTPTTSKQATDLRNKFIGLAEKAGASAGKARELADRLLDIPQETKPKITVNAAPAISAANEARAALNRINSRTVAVNVIVNTSRLDAVENRLNRLHGVGIGASAGSSHWAANDRQGSTSRTGGPTKVDVTSQVQVLLDGEPFRAYTSRAVQGNNARQAWRAKVGAR